MPDTRNENQIVYRFQFSATQALEYRIDFSAIPPIAEPSEWTKLAFHQCHHCPLTIDRVLHCPLATALEAPVRLLSDHLSHTEVDVQVVFRGREIRQRTTLQRAAGSMLGAVGATSGCPHTNFLRAMAWFHQPFSNTEETLFRSVGTYLLAQHLRAAHGLESDWSLDGLREAYRKLRQVNRGIAERLRHAAHEDSSVNALILLDLFASSALNALEEYEGELDNYFTDYLQQ